MSWDRQAFQCSVIKSIWMDSHRVLMMFTSGESYSVERENFLTPCFVRITLNMSHFCNKKKNHHMSDTKQGSMTEVITEL